MCGIAGFVGPAPLDPERVQRTLELMHHRGPDDAGHRSFQTPDGRHVELLHTRLRIIDLDPRANQPFRSGSKWLTYNGELYNYLEVRAHLEGLGEEFATQSDTEVLARAVDRLGLDGLDRCEGMWAFAMYDEADGRLLLSRDRFGEKPLYLYRDGDGLYFGSEAKLVFSLLGRRPPVNRRHIYRYLVNGYKSLYKTAETFYEGLWELPPGSLLDIGPDGTERSRSYWVPTEAVDDEMTYEEAVAGVHERLLRSVELRMRADVPLSFLMSGGVDSISLISLARRELGHDVHGFTIVNTDARYEEQDVIDEAVAELDVRHTPIGMDTADFLPRLRQLVRQHDAPVYTISHYAHWLLMESIAAHGYRISISGTAADELFSGYYDHHLAYLQEVHGSPDLHRQAADAWREHVAPIVRNPYLQDPDYFVRDPEARDHIFLDAASFAEYLVPEFHEPFTEERYTAGLLRNRMMNELFHEAVPVILHEDDHNAMSFSIENRSPYLDRELFAFSRRIPTRHLIRDGRAKAVLRDAMRGIAPTTVVDNRRKVGFNAPIHSFLDVKDPGVRAELLAESPIYDHVRRDRIEDLLDRESLPNSQSKFLFYFLNAKLFLEEAAA